MFYPPAKSDRDAVKKAVDKVIQDKLERLKEQCRNYRIAHAAGSG